MRDGLTETQRAALLRLIRAGVHGLAAFEFAGGYVRGVLGREGLATTGSDGRWRVTTLGAEWFGAQKAPAPAPEVRP